MTYVFFFAENNVMKATTYRVQLTFIIKTDQEAPHERISHIGGPGWIFTHAQAIQGILNHQYSFFVSIDGRILDIIVANHKGNLYLKTPLDMDQPQHLLNVPELSHAEMPLPEHHYSKTYAKSVGNGLVELEPR
jgi:Protein of unknown function (DUF3892)